MTRDNLHSLYRKKQLDITRHTYGVSLTVHKYTKHCFPNVKETVKKTTYTLLFPPFFFFNQVLNWNIYIRIIH